MSNALPQADQADPTDAGVRSDLSQANARLRAIPGLVRHMLATDESSLFSDDVIASVRGMMADLARQLLDALIERAPTDERVHKPGDLAAVRAALATQTALLTHVHVLAVEWRLLERMQAEAGIDPVRPPLVAALIIGDDAELGATAREMLAAQARFCRSQQRMALHLDELPANLLRGALAAAAAVVTPDKPVAPAERRLAGARDESRNRISLSRHVIAAMGGNVAEALSIAEAGPSFFLTALAMASGQDRDLMVLGTDVTQISRLALALRAAGVGTSASCEQILILHPTATPPPVVVELEPAAAAMILAGSGPVESR